MSRRYKELRDAYNARRPEVRVTNEALRHIGTTGPGAFPRQPWFLRTFMPCVMSFLKALLVIFLIFWVLTFIAATLTGVAALFMLVF